MNEDVQLSHVRQAAERIRAVAHRTPVFTSRSFDAIAGARAFFKCENFQRGGAFKIRGAANFVYSIPKDRLTCGVVSYSSGNHAQAVAIAAASVGTPATIVMPADAPKSKLDATRGYGARVVTYDRMTGSREAIGQEIAQQTGATLIPPYDHPWTIAGQGTVALEFLEEIADLDALVVPIGGGGLISGCAIAAKSLRPSIRIFGIEPQDGNDTYLSFRAGSRTEIPMPQTIADGLRATKPGAITFPIVQKFVDQIVLVSDEEIRETMKFLLARMKMLVEPSGAVTAAALYHGKLPAGLNRVGAILSGGNVDLDFLQTLGN
ncbi:MAG TPA: pyridoxal-phosphate dependent enzyme [Bryobacteraceae bacterium]|nr:pyridoxal-phosphate dependent enzyme [Bryobacteraceae bacterium]